MNLGISRQLAQVIVSLALERYTPVLLWMSEGCEYSLKRATALASVEVSSLTN